VVRILLNRHNTDFQIPNSITEYGTKQALRRGSGNHILNSPEVAAKFIHSKLELSHEIKCIDKKKAEENSLRSMYPIWQRKDVYLERTEKDYEYHDEYDYKYEEHIEVNLDDNLSVLNFYKHTSSNKHSVLFSRKDIIENATKNGAKYIIVSHCHPYNLPRPSNTDKCTINPMKRLLYAHGLTLLDDIIVSASGDYYSFSESGML